MSAPTGDRHRTATHFACAAALGCMLLLAAPSLSAQGSDSLTADQVKAGFIYHFTRYVDWPARANADVVHLHVCTAGRDGVVDQLESVVHGQAIDSRTIVVRPVNGTTDVRGCEMLYVGNVSRKEAQRLAGAVEGVPVLTVGSVPGFLPGADMLTFVMQENRVRFEINLEATDRAGLKISSKLLSLARSVTVGKAGP